MAAWTTRRTAVNVCVRCQAVLCTDFFFFQAEDGIRDYKVTGVQTCALPIFAAATLITSVAQAETLNFAIDWGAPGGAVETFQLDTLAGGADASGTAFVFFSIRSEERRVGKECRSRWSPYHLKKKKKIKTYIR